MTQLRAVVLVAVAVVAGLLGDIASVLAAARGWPAPVMHWASLVTLMALALVVLVGGIRVYRTRQRIARRAISRLVAFRVLVLAQAGAYAGAALGGWHVGALVDLMSSGGFGSAASWTAAAQGLGGLILVAVGYVVQALCKIPPEDSDGNEEGARGVEGAR